MLGSRSVRRVWGSISPVVPGGHSPESPPAGSPSRAGTAGRSRGGQQAAVRNLHPPGRGPPCRLCGHGVAAHSRLRARGRRGAGRTPLHSGTDGCEESGQEEPPHGLLDDEGRESDEAQRSPDEGLSPGRHAPAAATTTWTSRRPDKVRLRRRGSMADPGAEGIELGGEVVGGAALGSRRGTAAVERTSREARGGARVARNVSLNLVAVRGASRRLDGPFDTSCLAHRGAAATGKNPQEFPAVTISNQCHIDNKKAARDDIAAAGVAGGPAGGRLARALRSVASRPPTSRPPGRASAESPPPRT